MSQIGQKEKITQERIVNLFKDKLDYQYLGNWEDRPDNSNVETEILSKFLKGKQGYSESLIKKAIFKLEKTAGNQQKSLYDINKQIYSLLRYGVPVKEEPSKPTQTIQLINWKEPLKNEFAIAEEVTVSGEYTKRPDIVIYVNGIALGIIELKRSTISVSEGIRQNLDNQKSVFISQFFTTMQLIMAGNDSEGLRYGTIETPEKHYLTWKGGKEENLLDRHLLKLCQKERFLEIIHNFLVFDRGIKKVCRHSQYFGVKAVQEYLRKREGGIIWHAQGSGKSLVMIWLAKWIRENVKNSRVLIITDREELDEQIEKIFIGVDEQIHRTKSGSDLIDKLNNTIPWLLCSLIHKFGRKEEADYEEYINELKKALPKNFKAKGDIYVFVDECHRTQSGKLHKAMRHILPNAVIIGFTGTPLLKRDKQTSIEVFGPYIHTYKFDEAVEDKVILDLRYEARKVEQEITAQDKIDQWFEAKTKGLTDVAKEQLKMRWGSMKKVLSSKDRLSKIVGDIMFDMGTKDRLQNGRGNALLVSGSIYQACRYYEMFRAAGLEKCAIITSYVPSEYDLKGETTGEDGYTRNIRKYEIYQKMLEDHRYDIDEVDDFEKEAKRKFVNEPAQMRLLIVVDKLLTGFDAPPATYLYIDKTMRDHGLFQAICRVNRIDTEDKEYGYIVDYRDLFNSLEKSISDYTSGAFDNFEAEDVKGLLTNRLEKAKERLDEALESVKALCEPVSLPKDESAFRRYFCGDTSNKDELQDNQRKRIALYKHVVKLVRAYANIASEMPEAGYSKEEIQQIKKDIQYYEDIRKMIKLASGDAIDLKAYEPAMRHLIDTYISAEESKKISAFDDLSLIKLIVERGEAAIDQLPKNITKDREAVAETIENNLRKVIIDERPTNPKYYEKMSVLLDELIKARKEKVKNYEEYLKKILELTKFVTQPETSADYPKSLDTDAKRALYDNLGQDEKLALDIDLEIRRVKKDNFRGNRIKEREVKSAIKKYVKDSEVVENIFELVKNQNEY
jgi:type I restriction enzyme R subunit